MVALRSVTAADPQARVQALPSVGARVASLIRRFGDREHHPTRADIARAIRSAVVARNSLLLCNRLDLFGSTCEKAQMDLSDKACFQEAQALITCLIRAGKVPWDELRRELRVPAADPSLDLSPPGPKELARGQNFLTSPLVVNSNLTADARAFLAAQILIRREAWCDPKANFTSVVQEDNRIILIHAYGEIFLDIDPQ